MSAPQRILHVLNYGWPMIDGYTVRSMGILAAQRSALGLDARVVVSPFPSLSSAVDPSSESEHWGPRQQRSAVSGNSLLLKMASLAERPSLGFAPYTSASFHRRLAALIDELQPGVIHAHHPHYVGHVARQVASERRIPFVYEIRCFNGDYETRGLNPWRRLRGLIHNHRERMLCRQADAVVTICEALAKRIRSAGVSRQRIFVVRNSVDTHLFHLRAPKPRKPRTPVIGYATTFDPIEGIETLLKALRILLRRGIRLRAVLAGTGRHWKTIRNLVKKMGLGSLVELPGFLPYRQMPGFYESLDLFVVPRPAGPASIGTTPLKPLEALSVGVPVLASDLPALRELLEEQPGVRFFEPSAGPLAAALAEFAAASPRPVRPNLRGRTWDQEVRKYLKIYSAVRDRCR